MSGRPLSIAHQSALNRPSSSLSPSTLSGPAPRRKGCYRPFSTQSPYTIALSSPSLRRSASAGGLHQFCNNMGLQFGSKGKKELRPNSPLVLPSISDAFPPLRLTNKRSNAPSSASPKCSDELPVIDISKKLLSYEELDPCDGFVPKNIWTKRCKMKLHPYHKQVAYMQAYDPISLESDRYTDLLFQRLTNGSPSFHDYGKKPPAMVLDLGCGQGHWILHATKVWRNTEFVGFDIVDITLPAFETTENIRLVRGDFLNYELPFPDNTFDFVRIANLALCVPYDKWEFVCSQVRRVLTPGGRLELIDDDIYFPYGEGWKEMDSLVPASPLCGSFFGNKALETGIVSGDVDTNEMRDLDDGDSISMNPIMSGATDSSPTTSDLCLVRSRTAHYVLKRKRAHPSLRDWDSLSDTPGTPRYEKTGLKPTSSPRSPTPGDRRQRSELSRSTTPCPDIPPPMTRKVEKLGNPSLPFPKRTQEKVALLPSIRSNAPAFSLSSASRYSPTWSLRTPNTSSARSDASSIRTTDESPTTSIGSVVNQVDPNPDWQRKAIASKNMELLFEKMLTEQYGIHPRPSEFILRVLGKVFQEEGNDGAGDARVRLKESFHIKLAPTENIGDQSDNDHKENCRGGVEEVDGKASTSIGTSFNRNSKPKKQNGNPSTSLRPRPWKQGQDKELKAKRPMNKKEKDEDKKIKSKQDESRSKLKERQPGAVKTMPTMTVSLFKRSRLQDPALSTPVKPALSAKAAGILGIPYSELSAVTLSLSLSSERRPPAMPLPLSCPSNLSAKAAGRLGIPYSEALSAAASLSSPHNTAHLTLPSSTLTLSPAIGSEAAHSPLSNTTSGRVQHSGLLIWPNTYVPMAAEELEMHACKYIHALLGCRPALEEFVAEFADERGERLVDEEEFRDEIWEYECFRRGRFNWPSEAAEPYEEDPSNPNATWPSFSAYSMPRSSTDTGGTVDANHSNFSTPVLPATLIAVSVSADGPLQSKTTTHQPCTNEIGVFSKEKLLRPTKSGPLWRSSSPNRQRSPLPPFLPIKSKMMHSSTSSRPASPVPSHRPPPSCSRKASSESMIQGNRAYRKLDCLVHLRSIRVFEGVKA